MSSTIAITNEQKEIIKAYYKAYNKADASSLSVFEVCLDYFHTNKGIKKATIKANLIKEFKAIFDDKMLQASFVARLKKIIGIANDYRNFNIKYKNEEGEATLYYKTIEDIVKLLQFISDNAQELGSDVFPKVKQQIEEALDSNEGKVAYNNNVQALITQIKQENGIKGEEDALEFKGTKEQLIAMIKKQFKDEDIASIIEALSK